MKDKIVFFKFNNYVNHNLSNYLEGKKEANINEIIDHIKDNFDKNEVIPTILNTITNNIESKELIIYLDLINYYISVVSEEKLDYFKKLIIEKLQKILSIVTKAENRSIVYQFMIDYTELYDFDIKLIKKRYPIDKDMFLKKVVELGSSKSYLRFLLMYEVSIFFSKNELNSMWSTIVNLSRKEKELFFKIFYNAFNEKNQKKIFKFLMNSDKETISSFIPTLNFFNKDKELYFKNIFSLTKNDFNNFKRHQAKNGLFSQSQVFFSPKNQSIVFISDFFEYKKYSLIIETDFNLNYINSKIIKQPTLFNRSFFAKNYKENFKYRIKIDPIIAKEIFKGIVFNADTSNLPLALIVVNFFSFKNTLKEQEYKFLIDKNLEIEDFYIGKNILTQIINNNLHKFIEIEDILPKNISQRKSNIKLFIESPIFREKLDSYIGQNKNKILNTIKFFTELSRSLTNKKDTVNFFILLHRAISKKEKDFINIPQLKHLMLFELSLRGKKEIEN